MQGYRHQAGVTPLTTISCDSLGESVLILATLGVWRYEALIPKGGVFLPGNTGVPWYLKLRLPPGHFGLPMPGQQPTREEVSILTVALILTTRKGQDCCHPTGRSGNTDGVQWSTGASLDASCPVFMVGGQ